MKLEHLSIEATVMRKGMTLLDFFEQCTSCRVPGVPFVDDEDNIVGRISLRDVFKRLAIPDFVVKVAHILGNRTENIELPELKVRKLLALPVEDFVLPSIPNVTPQSGIIKALAIMEMFNSSYIFLTDDSNKYIGVVTRMLIAHRMMKTVRTMEEGESENEDSFVIV